MWESQLKSFKGHKYCVIRDKLKRNYFSLMSDAKYLDGGLEQYNSYNGMQKLNNSLINFEEEFLTYLNPDSNFTEPIVSI